MSDDQKGTSVSVEERAQSREELIHLLIESEDWAGLDAMTSHLSNVSDERSQEEAGVLVRHLLGSLKRATSDAARARLRFLVGQIYHRILKDANLAVSNYRLAVQADSTISDAYRAASELYQEHGRFKAVYQLRTLEHAVVTHPERIAEVLVDLIQLAERELDDTTAAYRWAMKLDALHPGHEVAVSTMARLEQVAGESAVRYAATLDEAKALRDRKGRAAFLLERAAEWHAKESSDPWIVELLREILRQDSRNQEAYEFLERILTERSLWLELAQHLSERLNRTPRKSDKIELLKRLAELATAHLADADQACQWFRQILKLSPLDRDALNFCVDHYSQIEDWGELVAVYEAALRTRQRGSEESAMLMQIALTLWKKMGDWERAEGYFRRIKLSEPKNTLMLKFYEAFYEERGDHRRLLSVLATQQSNEDSIEKKIAVGLRMARVAEDELGSNEKAIDIYRTILKLDPDQEAARAQLPSLFVATRKWNALLEHLKDELTRISGSNVDAQVDVLIEIVQVYRDRLRLPAMVLSTYQQILEVNPGHEEANEQLESTFRKGGRWNDLIALLTRRVERLYDEGATEASAALSREIARLWIEKFSNHAQAAQHLERIVDIVSDDVESIDLLIEIYEQKHDWQQLFDALNKKIELLESDARIDALTRMANLAVQRLDMVDEGIDLWRIVRQERPDEGESALIQLLERHERYEDLAEVYLERLADLTGPERVSQLKQLIPILTDKLGDEERAEEALNDILETDPSDAFAEAKLRDRYLAQSNWDGLEVLYGARDKWHALLSVLSAAAEDTVDDIESGELLMRMARICEESLSNTMAAMECWERLRLRQPNNPEAFSVLCPYYEREKRWSDFIELQEGALDPDSDQYVAQLVRLSEVYADEQRDYAKATDRIIAALHASPTRVDLLQSAMRYASLSDGFEQLFVAAQDLVEQVTDEELAYLRVVTEIGAEKLERFEESVVYFERIMELDPADVSAVNALCAIYEKLGRWDDLQNAYERALEFVTGSAREAELLASLAHLSADVLGDLDAAKEAYERILTNDEDNLVALQGLEAIAVQLSDEQTIQRCLVRQIPLLDDPLEVAHLRERLARLYIDRGAHQDAFDELSLVVNVRSGAASVQASLFDLIATDIGYEAGELLERVLVDSDEPKSLGLLYEMLLETETTPRIASDIYLKLGVLRRDKLSDLPGALAAFVESLTLAPEKEEVLELVSDLALDTENLEALRTVYERLAIGGSEMPDDPQLALKYSERLADLLDAEFEDLLSVRSVIEDTCRLHGDSLPRLGRLESCLTRLEDWHGLSEIKARQIAVAGDGTLKVDMLRDLARLSEDKLNDFEAAYQSWSTVDELIPLDDEAVQAMSRLLRELNHFPRLTELYARLYDARTPQDSAIGFTYAELCQQVDGYERAFTVYAELAEVVGKQQVCGPLGECIEKARVNGVDESQLRDASRLWADCLFEDAQWDRLKGTLEFLLELTEERIERLSLRKRLIGILIDGLGELEYACKVAFDGIVEDGPSSALFDVINESGSQVLAPTVLSDYFRGAVDSDAGEGLSPDLRRQWLDTACLTLMSLEFNDLALPFAVERSDLDPDDLQLLGIVSSLQSSLGDTEGQREVLERQFELSTVQSRKLELGRELIELLSEELDDAEDALRVAMILVEELDDVPADVVDRMEALLPSRTLHNELVEFYELVASRVSESSDRCAYLVKASEICLDTLTDVSRAASLLERALETDEQVLITLQRLEVLYAQEGNPIKQLNSLEQQLLHLDEMSAQSEVHLRIGELCSETLEEHERAVEAFETACANDTTTASAVDGLARMLADGHQSQRVARIICGLESRLNYRAVLVEALDFLRLESASAEERVRAAIEYGALLEAEDPLNAFQAIADAYRLSQGSAEVESELERIALVTENEHAYLAELVEMSEQNAERAVSILVKAAAFAELNLEDVDSAIALYREVLEREPDHVVAREGLEYLLEGQGAFEELAAFLEERANHTTDEALSLSLLQRAAELMDEELGDAENAIALWRRLYSDTNSNQSFTALERLYRTTGDWHALIVLLSDRAESAEADVASLFIKIIDVIVNQLEDGDGALETIESALTICDERTLFEHAKQLFLDRPRCDSIGLERQKLAAILEPGLEQDDVETRVECHLAQAETAENESQEQIDALRAAAGELLLLERYHEAFDLLVRCFETTLTEKDADMLRSFEGEEFRRRWYALLSQDVSDERVEESLRVERLFELSILAGEFSEDVHEERRWLTELLDIVPTERRAQEALCTSYRRAQEWEDFVYALLEFSENAEEPSDKLEHLLEACQLTEEVLADPEQAITLWNRVRDLEPGADRPNKALERLYIQVERFDELIDLYLDLITDAEEDDLLALRHSAGVVLIDRLSRLEDGVELLVANLASKRVYSQTLEYIENMMADASFSTLNDGVSLSILSALSVVYDAAERWSDWFIVRELLADRIDDVNEKITVRLEVVDRQTTLESVEVGFDSLKRLFLEFPEEEALYEYLLAFSTQHDNWAEFCDLIEDVLEETPGLARAETYLKKLRDVYVDDREIGVDDRLKHVCIRLLMFDESEVSALHTLVDVSESSAQWTECIKWFTRLAEHPDTPFSKTECFLRIADYQANASDETGQLDALRTAFESAPESLDILDRMIELKSASNDQEGVASLLRERIDLATDDERPQFIEELVCLLSDELGELTQAVGILEEYPTDLYKSEALRNRYEALLTELAQWTELANFYEQCLEATDGEEERSVWAFKVASIYTFELNRDELAVEHLASLLTADNVGVEVIDLMLALVDRPDAGIIAFRELDNYFAISGDNDRRIDVMYQVLKHLEDEDDRLPHFQTLSNLLVERDGPTEASFQALAQAFLLDSNDASRLETLTEWADTLGLASALIDVLDAALETDLDSEWRVDYVRRIARLCQNTGADTTRSVQLWQDVLMEEEYDEEALLALDAIYTHLQDWNRLLEVLARLVDVMPPEQVTDIRLRYGRLLEVVGSDSQSAIEQHQLILNVEPTNESALMELERLMGEPQYHEEIAQILSPIYRESQQFEKLAVLMELQVQSSSEMEQASLLLESGLIRLRELNDLKSAQENILAAYRIDPTSPQTSDALFELIEQAGAEPEFADAIEHGLPQQEPTQEKRLRLMLVDWFMGPLENSSKVEAQLRAVLEQDPEDVEVLTRLQLFFEDEERWEDVVDLIRLHIELSNDDAERLSLLNSAGGICESYLNDMDAAVEFYQSAYDLDPQATDVYERLEACLTQREDYIRLTELLEERLERIYDTDSLIRIYDTLAELYATELKQTDRAIEMIERRVEYQADHMTMEKLHALYAQQGQWSELSDSLLELCSQESDEGRLRNYLQSLIHVAENELGDHALTRRCCEQWIETGFPVKEVENRLASILQGQGEWSSLVELYERVLAESESVEEQCRVRHRLIELHLNEREDIDVASEHLEFVVEHDDSFSSRRLLAQLKNRQGFSEEAMSILTELTALSDIPDSEMALVHRDIGNLWLQRNENPKLALSGFEASFNLDGQLDTLRLLVEAARAVDNQEILLSALDSAVAFFDGAERLMTLREIIELRMEQNDFEGAVPFLEEIIIDAPTDVTVIRQLINCLETLGRTSDLKRYAVQWVNEFGTKRMSGLTAEVSFKLACILRDEGDADEALNLFQAVTRLDSSNVANLLALGGLLSDRERWRDTAKSLSTAVLYQDQMDDAERLSLFKLLGRAREELGELDKATQMYRRALAIAPKDDTVKQRLEQLRNV